MTTTDSPREDLFGLLDDLITQSTPYPFDDGVEEVSELVELLPKDLQPAGEVSERIDNAMALLIIDEDTTENSEFNDGVCEASRVVMRFLADLPKQPKWYIAEPFQLGKDVLDGWEGRMTYIERWMSAEECHNYGTAIFEVRPKPDVTITITIPKSVASDYAAQSFTSGGHWNSNAGAISDACKLALGVGS